MLGKIISINDNTVSLKLNVKLEEMQNIINLYVLLEDGDRRFIGEIVDIKEGVATINLVGEYNNDNFIFGISSKPSFKATSKLISKEKINNIIGIPNYDEKRDLYIGKSPIYEGVNIGININDFFSKQFAIFCSTLIK